MRSFARRHNFQPPNPIRVDWGRGPVSAGTPVVLMANLAVGGNSTG